MRDYSSKLYLNHYAHEIAIALKQVDPEKINKAYKIIEDNFDYGWPILTFGNGGSAAIAQHIAVDLSKCVAQDVGYPAMVQCLVTNSPLLSCIANDYSYSEVFSKQIEWVPDNGTLVIGISSSGNSPNIIKAFEIIQKRKRICGVNLRSIALVGFDGGAVLANNLADVIIHVSSNNYGVIEDCHMIILHSLIQKLRINKCKDISQVRL